MFTHLGEVDSSVNTSAVSAVSSLSARSNMLGVFSVVIIILLGVGLSSRM